MAGRTICLVRDAFDSIGGERGLEAAARVLVLLSGGFKVHLLFTGRMPGPGVWSILQKRWSAAGLRVELPGEGFDPRAHLRVRSYAIHQWLAHRPFDIADFDNDGSAFFTALAKRQQIAHRETTVTVVTSTILEGALDAAETFIDSPSALQELFMRERVLDLADVAFCDCEHTANSLRKRRAGPIFVGPPPMPCSVQKADAKGPISEIIFLGDQTTENGFQEFLEAAEAVAAKENVRFTLLGPFAPINQQHSGAAAALALSAHDAAPRFLTDRSFAETVDYLRRRGLLVVMPRRRSGTLALIMKCATLGSPLLASDIESHRALVADSASLVATDENLADSILRALRDPPKAEPRFDLAATNAAFCASLKAPPLPPFSPIADTAHPTISICLVHFRRPQLLDQALEGLACQTCLDFDLILINDGGEPEEVLSGMRKRLAAFPFPARLIATNDVWLGAARNLAASNATGEYLIFLDDDNAPMPNMVETMRAVARHRELDIGTCLFRVIQAYDRPTQEHARPVEYLPTGGPASAGLIENVFGDANAIISRRCFQELGGFDPKPRVGAEDWDFFLRAYLRGFKIEVIATPLYFYRMHEERLTHRRHSQYSYYRRLLGRFTEDLGTVARSELESVARLMLGRNATEFIQSTNVERNRHSSHGFLLDQLDASLSGENAGKDYFLLGQLLRDLGQDDASESTFLEGFAKKALEAKNSHETDDEETFIQFSICRSPRVISALDGSLVRFDQERDATLIHPAAIQPELSIPTTVELPFPLPHGCTTLSIDVAVMHPDGPEVEIELKVIDRPPRRMGLLLGLKRQKPVSFSRRIAPEDKWVSVDVNLGNGMWPARRYAQLTAHAIPDNSNAWVFFKNIKMRLRPSAAFSSRDKKMRSRVY